jgi:hypothetical protein
MREKQPLCDLIAAAPWRKAEIQLLPALCAGRSKTASYSADIRLSSDSPRALGVPEFLCA